MTALTALSLAVPPGAELGTTREAVAAEKPNLILILTDDQRADSMSVMPRTRARFPVEFSRGYVTTPVCCPSRASILTGRYANATGVHTNHDYPIFRDGHEPDSLGPWLKAQGYYTGFIGKYLNKYSVSDPIPPGWDEFYGRARYDYAEHAPGDGFRSILLREQTLVAGPDNNSYSRETHPDYYSTDDFGQKAVDFLSRAKLSGQPWALLVWTTAPHHPSIPDDEFANAPLPSWPRVPSFRERDVSDKPIEIRGSPMRKNKGRAYHRAIRDRHLRTLMSVDLMVERIFEKIEDAPHDQLDETYGFYLSDNGWLLGEHGLTQKMYAYEEASRVPFRMWHPGFPQSRRISSLVANVDIAPTFTELAGDTTDHSFDGTSLLPLVEGATSRLRSGVLIEGWHPKGYRAIRTPGWLYVYWRKTGHRELYNMTSDPYQLRNVARSRPGVARRLHRRLRALIAA